MLPQAQATATSAAATAGRRRPGSPKPKIRIATAAAATSVVPTGTRTASDAAHPMQTAPTRACGKRLVTSRDHQPFQLRHVRGADPGHALQLGHGVERAVRLAVVEDLLRSDRPDPR